jgi:hypothetical protein
MTAREMFNEQHYYEVLGEYIDDSKCYIKTIGKEYKKIALIKDEEILICLDNIDILTYKELQAINQQIKELNWDD